MKVNCAFFSHKGNVRENNEDSMLVHDVVYSGNSFSNTISLEIEDEERFLFAVADGMGGHAKGELASQVVLDTFRENMHKLKNIQDVKNIIYESKRKLDVIAQKERAHYGLGTTVCGILLFKNEAIIFNVGDSRLYRSDNNYLYKLTKDHSFVQYLVDNGVITEEEMLFHPKKNIVTSAITGDLLDEMPEIFFLDFKPVVGDQFIICTDGVWESLTQEEIEVCLLDKDIINKTDVIAENVLRYGGLDNLTIIYIQILQL